MRLRVMDSTAISLCMDNDMPIVVLNLWQEGSVRRFILGEQVGTAIGHFESE
jgi:uridylate kinase